MRIEILATGSELTAGQTIDTNSGMIARKLRDVGLEVARITQVGDSEEEIILALNALSQRSDALIVTGGLGPTADDRTRFAVAKVAGVELNENTEALERLVRLFELFKRKMPESNKVQALFPQGSTIIDNPMGTALGFSITAEDCLIVVGPGVPKELEYMVDNEIVPLMQKKAGREIFISSVILKTFGATESGLADMLADFDEKFPTVELAYSAKFPVIELRLSSKGDTKAKADDGLETTRKYLDDLLGDKIFGENKQTLPEVVGALLLEKKLTLATAESCTGGMIASAITDVSGSSDYFIEGAVTYANDAKIRRLGVKPEDLETYGAVSEEVATQMALGVCKESGADIGVAVTGIAGPTGGTKDKPVGTVHMALATPDGVQHWVNRFPGDRNRVRTLTCYTAFNRIRHYCLGMKS